MPKLSSRIIAVSVHSGVWICLFLYPFIFHYLSFSDVFAVLRITFFLGLLAAFFYLNSLVLITRLLGNRKVLLYIATVVAGILLISLGAGCLEECLNPRVTDQPALTNSARITGGITAFLAWVISSMVRITSEWFRSQRLRKDMEHEKVQAELSFLKTQINPHFLFNALNNIYALENQKSPHTGEAILRLSALARYMLYETSAEFVSLEKEVAYLRNYVELQKLGLDIITVSFTVKGEVAGKKIEPMLLIPLLENAFKHGISYASRAPIDIVIQLADEAVFLKVENGISLFPDKRDKTNGIGLANLKRRLEVLYPGKHVLETRTLGQKFIAELKIALKK